jgi:hypothetical protein
MLRASCAVSAGCVRVRARAHARHAVAGLRPRKDVQDRAPNRVAGSADLSWLGRCTVPELRATEPNRSPGRPLLIRRSLVQIQPRALTKTLQTCIFASLTACQGGGVATKVAVCQGRSKMPLCRLKMHPLVDLWWVTPGGVSRPVLATWESQSAVWGGSGAFALRSRRVEAFCGPARGARG